MQRPPLRLIACFVAVPLLLLVAAVVVSIATGIPIERFTRDPADLAQQNPLTGVLSNVGVLLWCIAAAVCAFAAAVQMREEGHIGETTRHLRAAAGLTAALLLDDLFMVHDDLARRWLGHGELFVIVPLGLAALAYLWRFRRAILAQRPALLLFALICFAASLVIDQLNDAKLLGKSSWTYFAEDAPKFVGIGAWCAWHWRLALGAVAPARVTAVDAARTAARKLRTISPSA